jgi:hypothetical protein
LIPWVLSRLPLSRHRVLDEPLSIENDLSGIKPVVEDTSHKRPLVELVMAQVFAHAVMSAPGVYPDELAIELTVDFDPFRTLRPGGIWPEAWRRPA